MSSSARSFFRLGYRTKSVIILLLMACGPQPFDYDEFKSFFMPESAVNEVPFHSYNFTPQFLYDDEYWGDEAQTSSAEIENTKAWTIYAGVNTGIVTAELYSTQESGNEKGLTKALKQKGNTDALEYIELSNRIAIADADNFDKTAPKPDFEGWLNQIKAKYAQSKDVFVKERLAYQAVKVADMAGKPLQSIEMYNELVTPLTKKTFISDWAKARMAGAFIRAGDSIQAYYHFSQIFVNAPTRRKEAYLSLRTYLPKLKDEALKLCKTNTERANVLAATAVLPFQDALPMLEQIRELDVDSPMLEFVMTREINKNEDFFFNSREDLKYAYWNLDSLKKARLIAEAPGYFNKLLNFSLVSAENPALKTSPFWYTAAAYLTFIAKDYKQAGELLEKAKAIPTNNKTLQDQIALQELTLLVSETESITPELENKVIPLLERFSGSYNFRVANNFNAACRILAAKYRGQEIVDEFAQGNNGAKSVLVATKPKASKPLGWFAGCFSKKDEELRQSPESIAKAFLLSMLTSSQLGYSKQSNERYGTAYFASNADQYAIEDSTSSATIYHVISYFSSNKAQDFDKRLIKLTGLNNDYLYTVLGRRALAEHQYAKAAEAWEHISPAKWQEEPFKTYLDVNPFNLEGQGDADPKQKVTPLSFAIRMAELQEKVSKNPADYESWMLLGCGSYNMGYYGNSWILQRRAWSGGEQKNEQDDYYTSTKALVYFDKAMQTAPSQDAAAKACYLAASCQKIRYELAYNALYDGLYLLPDSERANKEMEINKTLENLRKEKYATYFNLLKTKYQGTDYATQLIDECSTYKDFITGK